MIILAHTKQIYLGNDQTLTLPRGTVLTRFGSLSRHLGKSKYKVASIPAALGGEAQDYLRSRLFDACDVMRVSEADYNRVVHGSLQGLLARLR